MVLEKFLKCSRTDGENKSVKNKKENKKEKGDKKEKENKKEKSDKKEKENKKEKEDKKWKENKKGNKKENKKSVPLHRRTYRIDNRWVSASGTRNYLIRDPICDWLNLYHSKIIRTYPKLEEKIKLALSGEGGSKTVNRVCDSNFTEFLMEQGNQFERHVITAIIKKFGSKNVIDIGGTHYNAANQNKFVQTVEAIQNGVEIIYSGVLHDPETMTYGVPDLIVRSDILKKLVKVSPIGKEEEKVQAPVCRGRYHYRIIDIKFTTLSLRSGSDELLNSGCIAAYKGQIYVYNRILSKVQGYDSGIGYILGRRWRRNICGVEYRVENCFDRLGIIDYREVGDSKFIGFDRSYSIKTDMAINWLRDLRENGEKWDPFSPPKEKEEMYPNMSNYSDYPWREVKEEIANSTGELTSVWMVGTKNREKAHQNQIYDWRSKKCVSSMIGINGQKVAPIVNSILKINQEDKNIIFPKRIKNDFEGWKQEGKIEFYVDFETVSDIITEFEGIPEVTDTECIFMIGVGYFEKTKGEWRYKDFTVNQICKSEEKKICKQFVEYIDKIAKKYRSEDYKLIHWSGAEKYCWKNASYRHSQKEKFWNKIQNHWFDLLTVFRDEPIVINGCLNFSLKNVAKAMYQHKLISTTWDDQNPCASGLKAMVIAYNANKIAKTRNVHLRELPDIQDIITYNEVDCKVLYEIIMYLRHHLI